MSPWRRRRGPVDPAAAETAVVAPREGEVVEEEVRPARRPPAIWPWLLALLLLVLAGAAAYWLLAREDKTTMPRVVGLSEDAARARLAEANLEADVDRRPSSRREGIVFAQVPGAGKQLDEGQRVEIKVSTGPAGVLVPNVVGLREGAAVERIEEAELEPQIQRVFADEPEGIVVEQNLGEGTRVAEGSTVILRVSKGRRLVNVPDVVGLREGEAVGRLRNAGLGARIFDVPAAEPQGTVIAQDPAGGERASAGSRVRINVSSGRAEGTTTERTTTTAQGGGAPARAAVPSVVGLGQTAALQRVQAAGFEGTVTYVRSTQPAGRVVAQRPAPGTRLQRGAEVALQVSSGTTAATRTVPDVTGLDQQTATTQLRDAGFRVEILRQPTTDPGEEGIVVGQQPAGGTRAPRGSVVTLYVGQLEGG